MALKDAPTVCSLCGHPKEKLKRLTELMHEPIYVCVTVPKKGKMPCDGHVFKVAEKYDKA